MQNDVALVGVTINHGANGRNVNVEVGTTVEQLYNKVKAHFRLPEREKCNPEITGIDGSVSWDTKLEGGEIIQFPKVTGDKG